MKEWQSGLTFNEADYIGAVKWLEDRYGKRQLIISAHMEEINKLPACSGDKSSSLRYVFDVNLRGLASLGMGTEQYGSLLIPIVMTKLPSELCLWIACQTDKEVWEIDELLLRKRLRQGKPLNTSSCIKQLRIPMHFKLFSSQLPPHLLLLLVGPL